MASSNHWNQETKARLTDKVATNINDLVSLTRQVTKGSKTNELLAQAAKNFAFQEGAIKNSHDQITRLGLITSQLHFQAESIEKSVELTDEIQDQLKTILR